MMAAAVHDAAVASCATTAALLSGEKPDSAPNPLIHMVWVDLARGATMAGPMQPGLGARVAPIAAPMQTGLGARVAPSGAV